MLNLCHISSLKRQKVCAFVLIVCLISGLTPTAESVSVKLRGKIALGGILSGLACVTYALITRDKRAAEKLQLHLGPPDRVIQFERGFDLWHINYYGERCYLFRNNLFIETVPCTSLQSDFSDRWSFAPPTIGKQSGAKHEGRTFKNPFLIDIPVSSPPSGCGFAFRVHGKPLNLYLPIFIGGETNVCLVGGCRFHVSGHENRIQHCGIFPHCDT